jgi:drug/metabolite transporter (DMT)-like permease
MKYVSASISFLFVFIGVFFLAGWFLMPYLPPIPNRPVSVFENEYWIDNWIGLLLGIVLGGLSAISVLKKANKKKDTESNQQSESIRS